MGIASGYPKFSHTTAEHTLIESSYGLPRVDRRYSAVWKIRTTDDLDTALTAGSHANLPSIGDTFDVGNDADSYSICRSLRCYQPMPEDDRKFWLFEARYGRMGLPPDEPSNPAQPWTRGNKWRISQSDYVEYLYEDKDGNAIVNSANQRYVDVVDREAARTLITVTYYKQSLKTSVLDEYRKAINDGGFWGYSAKTLRMNSLTAEEQYENGYYYWEITAEIEVNPDEWKKEPLDEGLMTMEGTGASATWKVLEDDSGNQHAIPTLLDGSGGILDPNGTPQYGEHYVYAEKNFSSSNLGLPSFPSHLTYS